MDINDIRKKKQQELEEQLAKQQEVADHVATLEGQAKSYLTREAYERYSRLKLAHPEHATRVLVLVTQAINTGKITQVNDAAFKDILSKISPKKEFSIKRK